MKLKFAMMVFCSKNNYLAITILEQVTVKVNYRYMLFKFYLQ